MYILNSFLKTGPALPPSNTVFIADGISVCCHRVVRGGGTKRNTPFATVSNVPLASCATRVQKAWMPCDAA